MEKSFAQVRKELDDLGYTETFKPECLPLVARLLGDLKITTESLRKYMRISQQALEERDSLQLVAEPYKCDNAKLIKECNELHLAFIQFKEQHEKVQRDLRTKIISLENRLTDCGLEKQKLLDKLKDLQFDLKNPINTGNQQKQRGQPLLTKSKHIEKNRQFHLSTAMASADSKISSLSQEVKKLKEEQLDILKNNEFLSSQLENRTEEIKRLSALLEGGRPTKAISRDCCYKNIDNKIGSLQDEINKLKRDKNTLQNQLTEAIARQHEAMRRALTLAERNKVLEEEMKDIDQIALTVEAECNDTLKSNFEKVTKLQDKINESLITIQSLEREVAKLKLDRTELISELEAVKIEKKNLQMLLETETDDKKRLTDRLNNFTVIEQSLNMEIDRLLRLTGEQKRKIAELESEVVTQKVRTSSLEHKTVYGRNQESNKMPKPMNGSLGHVLPKKSSSGSKTHKKTCKKTLSSTKPDSKDESAPNMAQKSQKKFDENDMTSAALQYDSQTGFKCCCEAGGCVKWMRELLEKDIKLRQEQAGQQIESLRKEKEFYLKEYHKVLEKQKLTPSSEKSNKQVEELINQIHDKDQLISTLQDDVKTLSSEKYALSSRLEARSRELLVMDLEDSCAKVCCKRKSRELEVYREEVKHLERENSSLKAKIQAINETNIFNEEQMKKAFQDMEQHIMKLENERRDLVINQGSNRSNISQLEEECQKLREKLKIAQNEANNQKANYEQLKILHDQSNRALADTQSQLLRAETEYQNLQSKMSLTHRETSNHEREISRLQGDVEVMKNQLSKIDKEKDELLNVVDDKTEQVDRLENQLREKRNQLSALELENKDFRRRLSKISEESSSREVESRNCRQTIHILEQDLENERRLKEAALQENRRLQDDLSSATLDCREARKDLEILKRQVEDLKRQLQQYVAEVKRTEDLISQKELERTEILDQFKSLSQENNVLESTNHTLESEATQSRVQLSVALDHATDLERKVDHQEAIIKSYEKQISELSNQVASLEIQLKQGSSMTDRVSTELKQLKDLCVRLDSDKDELKQKLRAKDDEKISIERQIDFLSRENKELKRALEKDQDNQDGLERLLKDARQEVIDQRLLNEDLQSEINKLRTKIDDLQGRLKDYPETKTTEKKVKVSTDASPPLIKFTEEIGTSRTAKVVSQTREIHKNLSEPYKSYPDITHPRIKKIRNASKDELQHNDFQKTASIKSPKKPTLLNTEQKVSASNDNILCTDDIVNTSTSENVNAGYSQQIPSNKASKEFEGYPLVRSKKYFMTGSDIDAILKEGHTSTFPKAADRNKLSTNNENMPEITNVRNREVSIGRILPDSNAHFDHCQRNYYKEKNNLALEEEEKNRSHTANDHNKSSTNNDNNRQEIPSVRNQRSSHGIIVVESSDPQGNYSKEISKSNTQNLVLEEKKNRSHIANDNNKISRNNKNNIQEIPCVRNHRSSPSITVPDSGDAHFPRSQRYNSKEKNISNTNNLVLEEEKSRSHTVTNIFDQMKPLRESNEEKRDLEKNIESKVVKQVNAINSDIEVGEKNEKMSEESSKNVGVATNSLKDRFASYVDENVQCCKRCYPTELRKNKEKSTSKSFKLSICKCTCGNRKDDAVNACMCCPNCPVNLQFQNIFGDRFCSIENV